MLASKEDILEAGKIMMAKVVKEYMLAGLPMVIQPDPTRLQWIMPQPDGTFKVVREQIISKKA